MENNFNIHTYQLTFFWMNYPSSKTTKAEHKAMATREFISYDRTISTYSLEDHVDMMQMIMDGINEQFPDEEPIELNLTAEVKGLRYITCVKGGFIFKVKEI